ncbi:MAG: carboxypeptidase-like regulatory domain-containing protein, partial [Longimicrobiales bacterium]
NGIPADGIASVTAYIQDTHPPYNRSENQVPVGGRVLFDNLGVGFDIELGLRDLGTHRCEIRDGRWNGLSITDSTTIVQTRHDQTEQIAFDVLCRSATIDVLVNGLPAGDSARITLATPSDTMNDTYVRNGSQTVAIVAGPVTILPDLVSGSDGFAYSAAPQMVAPLSAQTTTVTLDYSIDAQNQAEIELRVSGIPDDTSLIFRGFIRSLTSPFDSDSATIAMDGGHVFPNLPAGVQYEVTLTGLAAYRCHIRVNAVWTFVGDTTSQTVTTQRLDDTEYAGFDLLCHSAALDLVVVGLTPGDSARIDVDGVFSAEQLHVPNGTSRLYFAPYRIRTVPQPVAGSDGLTYVAGPDSIDIVSRQTMTLTVLYAAQQPGSIAGRVTGNGNGIGGATVTLSGDASAVATTAGSGAYRFANLAPGTYTLTVATPFPGITFPAPSQTVTLVSG